MKIFIDFDDVVFNTKRFKEELRSVFAQLGISKEIYDATYYDPADEGKVKVYDPRKQIGRIKDTCNVDCEKLLESVNKFMEVCRSYVFSDVPDFVGSLGKENIYLLSYGDIGFQEDKIKCSGITKLIEKISITDKLKAAAVEEIIKKDNICADDKIFFLDDRVEQISDVKNKFPQIMTILVKRPEGRYQEMQKEGCCDYEAHNLEEAANIIKSLL